jgi:ankyrin repeat protein
MNGKIQTNNIVGFRIFKYLVILSVHYAAQSGHSEVCWQLIIVGANLDAQTPDGRTPLILAACWGHAHTVLLLRDHHADKDGQGLTAYQHAFNNGQQGVLQVSSTSPFSESPFKYDIF